MDQFQVLAVNAKPSPNRDYIIIESRSKPNIEMTTIHISCESDPYQRGHDYAGFILYAHGDPVKTDWWLNGKHCKTGYLVIQDSSRPDVQRYKSKSEGVIHGAVYKNVFGEAVGTAVGEGFAYLKGEFKWNSYTFNARDDSYHDGEKKVAKVTEQCVGLVLRYWKQSEGNLPICRNYEVKTLLSEVGKGP